MSARMQVKLPNGRLLFVGGDGTGIGLGEVSASGRVAEAGADAFSKGLETLADLSGMLDAAVRRLPTRPTSIEMEFRAKLTAECDLWIVSGEGEAEFTVKLTWGA